MSMEKYLLRLYPRTWRERYEDEVLAMLDQRSLSFTDRVNLFFGALDAQLNPHLGTTGMSLYERILHLFFTIRRSLLTIFCAFLGFVLAGWGFQKMTEYNDFMEAARTHSVIGLSFNLIVIGGVVALLAVLAGGVPIVIAIIRSALAQKRRGLLLLLAVPILAFAVFLGTTFLLEALDNSSNHLAHAGQLFVPHGIFFGTLIAAAVASAGALCMAVARSEIPEKLLRFAVLPSVLATISMALVLVATITWGLGLRDGAPQLFSGNDGIVGSSTTGTWLEIVIVMAITTVLATISLIRGLSARAALRNAAA